MTNWIEYIDEYFKDFEDENLSEHKDSFYPNRNFRINDIYIFFEFEDIDNLRKIEYGKFYPADDNPKNYTISNAKIVFNKTKENYTEIIQHTFDGEYGKKYELSFNPENVSLLNSFLKIPLEIGWTQESYFYKSELYKMNINLLGKNYNLIIQDIGQQDLPFPGDKLSSRIEAYILDLKMYNKHRKVEIEKITPIKTAHNR